MSGIRNTPPIPGAPYEIRGKGFLDSSWPEWLGDLNISTARDGIGDPITLIEGFFYRSGRPPRRIGQMVGPERDLDRSKAVKPSN